MESLILKILIGNNSFLKELCNKPYNQTGELINYEMLFAATPGQNSLM